MGNRGGQGKLEVHMEEMGQEAIFQLWHQAETSLKAIFEQSFEEIKQLATKILRKGHFMQSPGNRNMLTCSRKDK